MKTYIFIFLLVLTSCIGRTKIPEDVIPKEKMVAVLTDIHIIEAKVGEMNFRTADSTRNVQLFMENEIYKKHKIDSASYNRSYKFYLEHSYYLEEIYSEVVDTLIAKQNDIGKEEKFRKKPDLKNPKKAVKPQTK